ncbi:MAG: CPBP family intramembrane metalloprotease, partial [Oscillospiraceae bacterium]|nr:CPBP family intramembrane metalloprotease [Oscillospiraceae bacterium]
TNYPLVDRVRAVETFRTPKNLLLKCLIFIGIFILVQVIASFGMYAGIMPELMKWAMETAQANGGELSTMELQEKLATLLQDPKMTNIMLYATGLATIGTLIYCRFVEGRKLNTIGFKAKGGLIQYLLGLVAGFVMFSMVVLLAWAMCGLTLNGFQGSSWTGLLVVFIGYGIQGMSEEVICRGYFMTTILRHQNVYWAVGLNSLFFGLMHAGNSGFSAFALLNLVLYAVMISIYMLRTDNLWGACAIHSIWNFVQGNFYGLPVSGIDSGASVFSMSLKGSILANGGDFGLEASLATTIVMAAVITLLLFVPPFTKKQTQESAA